MISLWLNYRRLCGVKNLFNTDLEEVEKKQQVKTVTSPVNWHIKVFKSSFLDRKISAISSNEKEEESISSAILLFIGLKFKKLKELENNEQVIMPKNLYIDNNDRGKFKKPALRKFEHYHLKLRNDQRKGDIALVYKQIIDLDDKILNLYLTAVGTHADYDQLEFAKSCNAAKYTFIKTLESRLSKKISLIEI